MAVRAGIGRTPNPTGFRIDRSVFRDIEDFMADNIASAQKMQQGMNMLMWGMALSTKGFAQEMSKGPVAPRQRSVPALAYRIPVQRITGKYFEGWQHKRLGHAHWLVYNDSREAWLIEYGIYQKVRRPIMKMAANKTLSMLQGTKTAERFLGWVVTPTQRGSGNPLGDTGQTLISRMAGPKGPLPG